LVSRWRKILVRGSVPGLDASVQTSASTSYVRADTPADGWMLTIKIPDLENEESAPLARKERQRSQAANAEDFYRERTRQLTAANLLIAGTMQSTAKRQRCEVTLTLLEQVRTAKLGRDIAERGVEFWRSQPRGTGDERDLELFTHE